VIKITLEIIKTEPGHSL